MGEVIGAADELRAIGLPPGAFHALLAIAEKAHADTRQGSVRWDHIRSTMYASNSLRSAERAVKALKDAGLIRVVQRGFNNQAGTARAPIYEVCALPVSATHDGGFGPSVSATQGGGFDAEANPPNLRANPPKSGGEPATHGVGLDGSIDGSIDGSNARSTRARRQRQQPTFGEMVRGRPDAPLDPPPPDASIVPLSATSAADLIREELPPSAYQPATLTALRFVVAELLNTGNDAEVVRDALRLWDAHPTAGPGLLRSLMAEASKARRPFGKTGVGKPTRKALGYELAGAELLAEMGYE
ncbi:hypothetical protein [Mycobacterium sp. SM3041]|uniref:hypothetical protein n=1 Tax=Mycobacterium sp. SM3041 TaxID=3114291 RepID=UPI0032048A44